MMHRSASTSSVSTGVRRRARTPTDALGSRDRPGSGRACSRCGAGPLHCAILRPVPMSSGSSSGTLHPRSRYRRGPERSHRKVSADLTATVTWSPIPLAQPDVLGGHRAWCAGGSPNESCALPSTRGLRITFRPGGPPRAHADRRRSGRRDRAARADGRRRPLATGARGERQPDSVHPMSRMVTPQVPHHRVGSQLHHASRVVSRSTGVVVDHHVGAQPHPVPGLPDLATRGRRPPSRGRSSRRTHPARGRPDAGVAMHDPPSQSSSTSRPGSVTAHRPAVGTSRCAPTAWTIARGTLGSHPPTPISGRPSGSTLFIATAATPGSASTSPTISSICAVDGRLSGSA